MTRACVSISHGTYTAIRDAARDRGITMSQLVEQALGGAPTVTIAVDPETKARIEHRARMQGISPARVVAMAVAQMIRRAA